VHLASPGGRRSRARPALDGADLEAALAGLGLGLAVTGPWLGGGRTLMLDWAPGPHAPVVGPGLLGLSGGLTSGALGSVGFGALGRLVGPALTWLVVLAVFIVGAAGASRLTGGGRPARLAAAVLYCVNPFVFNRLYAGHLSLLLGYALLPLAVTSALRAPARRGPGALAPALWWAVLTALSPHYAWIYGAVVLICFAVGRPWGLRRAAWFGATWAAFVVMSLYVLLPHSATKPLAAVGATSLELYRTTADPHYGLLVNVAGLYGFWRLGPGPELPKAVVVGWPLLLLAILVVAGVGAVTALGRPWPEPGHSASRGAHRRRDDGAGPESTARRRQAAVLLLAGAAGYFLALGSQGPTGPLFRWAYFNLPFFQVMREPQKFLMLTALAYATFFGWGVECLARPVASAKGAALAARAAGVTLPLLYCPTIFWGLAGQVSPTTLPASYHKLDALMGEGQGRVLYLPWHLYMAYPFTGGRVVANLGPSSFRRPVVSGDNVQIGSVETQSTSPRSAYIGRLLAAGPHLQGFGALVAPLGVRYVVLAKAVDWRNYGWLGHQRDLRLVYDSSSLEAWANLAYGGIGQRVARPEALPSFPALLARAGASPAGTSPAGASPAAAGGLDAGAVVDGPGAAAGARAAAGPGEGRGARVQEISPVAYRVPPGRPGWVTVDTTYQEGWYLDGKPAVATAEGTMMFPAGAAGGVVRFRPWGLAKLGYDLSSGAFVVVAAVVGWGRWREKKGVRGPSPVGR
jgi:hypothetical protein